VSSPSGAVGGPASSPSDAAAVRGQELAEVGAMAAAALREAAGVLARLTPDQLADLAAGRARLVYERGGDATDELGEAPVPVAVPAARATPVRPARRGADAPDPEVVEEAVRTIRGLHTPGEVAEHLHRRRYPVPILRQIARALGPTVSTAARDRAGLERNIVEGTAGYRTRSAAMSGGAWS
jgi:hypothetical protein